METATHQNLKMLAMAFFFGEGYRAIAAEVRCPGSRYRVDVAGYMDRLPYPQSHDARGDATLWSTAPEARSRNGRNAGTGAIEPRTVIVECKQSRGDFIRDDRSADELISLRDELRTWKKVLEENRIKPREPELRISGSALFPEMEVWDFNASQQRSYRRLLQRIRVVEKQLYGETKFFLMSRYRLADRLYLAVPRGLLRKREAPAGWGVIELPRERSPSMMPTPRVLIAPTVQPSPAAQRARLLRNIAVAATRDALRSSLAAAH